MSDQEPDPDGTVESLAPATAPAGRPGRWRPTERLQLVAGLLGAAATLLAGGSAIAAGDHRKVMLVTFAAGVALAAGAVVKYRRATRARPPGGPPAG